MAASWVPPHYAEDFITPYFSYTVRGQINYWYTPLCWKQTENECGPRTVKGISEITRGIKNSVSIVDCIANTTLINSNSNNYDARALRREMSDLLILHRQEMQPQRIVFKESGTVIRKNGKSKRNKFKSKRQRE